jgi:magnesium transporter
MPKYISKHAKKAGMLPGSLTVIDVPKQSNIRIQVMQYDKDHVYESEVSDISTVLPLAENNLITWINIDGLHNPAVVKAVGDCFNVHPLILEDIVHVEQRPKMEEFDSHIYIVLKMFSFNEAKKHVEAEQISFLLCKNCLITFQEKTGDCFDLIRGHLRTGKGRIRKAGADYLAYSLMDAIIDNYFVVLERLGEITDAFEEAMVTTPNSVKLVTVHRLKQDMLFMRKSVWPLRELLSRVQRDDSPLIDAATGPYFQDLYDHTIQIIDTIESLRDMMMSMLDIYLTSMSHRLNEVMKVLTIIATIFMPLTFIAGVYGMNFEFMPELKWHLGYFMVLGLMSLTALSMVIFFKRKKWL